MKLTQHFTLEEFTLSQTAVRANIDNTPLPEVIEVIQKTAEGLEKIRKLTGGKSIQISSGYRCRFLNNIVGGSPKSQHIRGEAADIICPSYGTPLELAILISDNMKELGIDQVILEFGRWVHVSFSDSPQYEALTIRSRAEGYLPGILT